MALPMSLRAYDRDLQEPPPTPCRCEYGRYPQSDPLRRVWWWQITSICERHWPTVDYWTRIRILTHEWREQLAKRKENADA